MPALAVYLFVMGYPLAHSLLMSFYESTGLGGDAPRWVGLSNYETLFLDDPVFWVAMKNTLLWTAYSLIFCITKLVIDESDFSSIRIKFLEFLNIILIL